MPLLRRKTRDEGIPKAGPYAPGWDVPARFNFTRDVIEAIATDPLKPAMTFVDREGIVDRRTFHEIAGDAARWAHLMRTRLDRGDRVVLAIGNVPSWQAAMLGAIKSGLVAVPCTQYPPRTGSRVPRRQLGRAARRGRPVARARDRGDAPPGRRLGIGALPGRGARRAAPVHARRADRGHDRRRDRPDPLHVRHGQGAEGRRAHACVHVGAAGPGDALARRARGRRRLVHLGDGVGEGDLELAPRPVVARGGDRGARRIVRCPGAALPPAAARCHDPRPDSDGVPDARQAREAGVHASAPAPPRRLGRRAAQSRGHRAIPGCAGAHGARRLRPDRERPSHREHARRPHPAGVHGPSDPGPRRGRDRRRRARSARPASRETSRSSAVRRRSSPATGRRPTRPPRSSGTTGTSRAIERRATRTGTSGSSGAQTT